MALLMVMILSLRSGAAGGKGVAVKQM